jgi:SecY/SecDF, P1 head subdomain
VELPRAVASNERSPLDPRSRRLVAAVGAIGALLVSLAFVVRPLPGIALVMFGGAGDGVSRYGGLRISFEPPPGFDRATLHESAQMHFEGNLIVIEVPKVTPDDADEVATMIVGGIEFREVIEGNTAAEIERMGLASSPRRHSGWGDEPREPIVEIDGWRGEDGGPTYTDFYLRAHSRKLLEDTFAEAQRRGWRPPDHTVPAYELVEPPLEAKDPRPYWRSYFVADRPALDGRAIANATGSYDPNTNRPIVLLDFNREGAEQFGELTARIVNHKLATILGGRVRSAPIIMGAIRGGRASITMGGSDAPRMERERDALVKTLSAGSTLPPGGTVRQKQYVPRPDQTIPAILARIALAVLGWLVGSVFAWLALRFGRPERREVARVEGTRPASPRLAWTIIGIAIFYMGTQITLPGVNQLELAHVIYKSSGYLDFTQLSVFALGVTPVITSFMLVEVIFAIVPRWRPLRDRPEGRRKIARVVAIVAAVIVTAQAYFVATYLESLSRGGADVFEGSRWMVVATLVGGTMLLVIVASMIGHRGIGNGYAVLIAAQWIGQIQWDELVHVPGVKLAFAAVVLVVLIGIAVCLLRWRVRGIRQAPLALPISGISPIAEAGVVSAIVFQLVSLNALRSDNGFVVWLGSISHQLAFGLVALAGWAVLWAFVFARPGRRKAELARAELEPVDRASWLRALALGTAMLAAMFVIAHVLRRIHPLLEHVFDATMLVFTVATILDVVGEVRDRRRELIPVWPLHDPLLVDVVRDRLTAADIPHHMQAAHARSLSWLFGPHIPVMVLVPPEHAKAADASIRELLG